MTGEGQAVTPVDGNAASAAAAAPIASTPEPTSSPSASGENLLGGNRTGEISSPTSSPWSLNEKGEFGDGWLDRLPSEFNDSKQILGQFKNPEMLAKSLINAQRLLGKKADAVLMPNEKSTPEEWQAFRAKMGVPEKAEDYLTKLEKDSYDPNNPAFKEFTEIAHKNGYTPAQVQEAVKYFNAIEARRGEEALKAKQAEFEADKKSLADAWGDKYEANKIKAEKMAASLGLPLDTSKWKPSEIVQALARATDLVSEDRIVGSDASPTFQVGRVKANDIMRNPQNPYHQGWLSGDKQVRDMVASLLKNG